MSRLSGEVGSSPAQSLLLPHPPNKAAQSANQVKVWIGRDRHHDSRRGEDGVIVAAARRRFGAAAILFPLAFCAGPQETPAAALPAHHMHRGRSSFANPIAPSALARRPYATIRFGTHPRGFPRKLTSSARGGDLQPDNRRNLLPECELLHLRFGRDLLHDVQSISRPHQRLLYRSTSSCESRDI